MQDSYIKIFMDLNTLKDPEKFVPWGGRIVTNTALNALRKNSPVFTDEAALLDQADYEPTRDVVSELDNPEEIWEQKETKTIIQNIVNAIPEDQRVCIWLFYMQEYSVKEISSQLHISANTVKSRLKYGRSKIEEQILLMEKKGVRLHSLGTAPFAVFLWMVSKMLQEEQANIPKNIMIQQALLQQVAEKSLGAASSAGAGNTISKTAAATSHTAGKAIQNQSSGYAAGKDDQTSSERRR